MHPITKQLLHLSLGVIIWFLIGSAAGIGWRYSQRLSASGRAPVPQVIGPQPAASSQSPHKLV